MLLNQWTIINGTHAFKQDTMQDTIQRTIACTTHNSRIYHYNGFTIQMFIPSLEPGPYRFYVDLYIRAWEIWIWTFPKVLKNRASNENKTGLNI